ncbi:hypothetical protein TNCV_355111 [Trichonephila clavipes]|uniref:Uncharacterized protein n=1 Tax=Trichonephila clavipes TaxID=2585209 RepID=A0A8X6W0X4_TRICX|nr:hypothetical protein TNCV_355111 [Trichonephila clavipes]
MYIAAQDSRTVWASSEQRKFRDSPKKPDNGVAWNSLCSKDSWYFTYHLGSYRYSSNRDSIRHYFHKEIVPYTPKQIYSFKKQYHVAFYLPMFRSCDVERDCSGNVPGTTSEGKVRYNLHPPDISSVCRPVPRLDKSSPYCIGKWIANAAGSVFKKPSIYHYLP